METTIPVFILAGQSNARIPGLDSRLHAQLTTLHGQDGFEFIKSAQGGTRLFPHPVNRDWHPTSQGELLDETLQEIRDVLAGIRQAGFEPDVRAFVWIQGEGDALELERAEAYASSMADLISAVRVETGQSDLPIIVPKLASTTYPYRDELRAQQDLMAQQDPNVHLVETLDLSFVDGVHYDRVSQHLLADRIVASIPNLPPANTVPEPTGYTPQFLPQVTFETTYGDDRISYLPFGLKDVQSVWINLKAGNDFFRSQSGHDTILAGAGDDTIFAGFGEDVVLCHGGNDQVTGGKGKDTLRGGEDSDRLSGDENADFLTGGDGVDTLMGGAGDDSLAGGAGADHIDGGEGNDTVSYYNAAGDVIVDLSAGLVWNRANTWNNDTVTAIESVVGSWRGDDDLFGDAFDNRLNGVAGFDLLYGRDGNDQLYGGRGEDRLIGGQGEDTLVGGSDNDILSGGMDGDTFIFVGNFGQDTITDFGEGDMARIGTTGSGFNTFADYDANGDGLVNTDDTLLTTNVVAGPGGDLTLVFNQTGGLQILFADVSALEIGDIVFI
ncbi:MAG: sialate O-acetylesterase [Pseudomonadota bacterium]